MEATKKPQNYLRIMGRLFPQNLGGLFPQNLGGLFPQNLGGLFPQNLGGLFPQNLGGLTPAKQKKKNPPLGFEPKCAAAVLLKHTIYKYSDHPHIIFHTLRLSGPAPSYQHRASSCVQFFPHPHTMALELVCRGAGGCVFSRPGGPRTRSGLPPSPVFAARLCGAGVGAGVSACAGVSRLTPNLSRHALSTLPLRRFSLVCVCVCGGGGCQSPRLHAPLRGGMRTGSQSLFAGD